MELIYLWIGNFRNLKNMGMSFSDKYCVDYKNRNLSVKETENYYDYFGAFSENSKVSSITALVGKNGCGKSNILELIGSNEKRFIIDTEDSYFILYKHNKKFFIEGHKLKTLIKNLNLSSFKSDSFSGEVCCVENIWHTYHSKPELKGSVTVRERLLNTHKFRDLDAVKCRLDTTIINNLKFNGDNSIGPVCDIKESDLVPRYNFESGEELEFSATERDETVSDNFTAKLQFLKANSGIKSSDVTLFNNTENVRIRIHSPKVSDLQKLLIPNYSLETVINQFEPLADSQTISEFKEILNTIYRDDLPPDDIDNGSRSVLQRDHIEELRLFSRIVDSYSEDSKYDSIFAEFKNEINKYTCILSVNEIINRGNMNDYYGSSAKEHMLTQLTLSLCTKQILKIINGDGFYSGYNDGSEDEENRIISRLSEIFQTNKEAYRNSQLKDDIQEALLSFSEELSSTPYEPVFKDDFALLKKLIQLISAIDDKFFNVNTVEFALKDADEVFDELIGFIDAIPSYSMIDKMDIRICNLSAGELSFLTFFSQLATSIKESRNAQNFTNCILLLDEPDDNLHPEWKRRFLAELTNMLNTMIPDEYDNYQIIIATHSPFLLSDLPRDSVIRLEYDEGEQNPDKKYKVVKKSSDRYLGANIHELLYDKFFMSSAIGEYAKIKINKLLDLINKEDEFTPEEKNVFKASKSLIEEIAEPILRNSLMSQWEERNLSELSELDKLEVLIKENEAKHEKLLNKQKRLSKKEKIKLISDDNNDSD